MKKYIHLLTASVLLASLTACSQQQVAGEGGSGGSQVAGSSQQIAGSSQQTQTAPETKTDADCRGCNAPKIEAVVKPAPKPVAAVARPAPKPAPRPSIAYQPRQHVPTVPNKKNASSAMVKSLQNALSAKGYNPGTTDGVMGSRTSSALNAFQKANNLPSGINDATLKALGIK